MSEEELREEIIKILVTKGVKAKATIDELVLLISQEKNKMLDELSEKIGDGYSGSSFNGMVRLNVVAVGTIRRVIAELRAKNKSHE